MDEILEAFSEESKAIIERMIAVLEGVDEDASRFQDLKEFARLVDGVMGSAKVLAVDFHPGHPIQKMANFSELCKLIGQNGAKVEKSEQFTRIITSFLLDASETLRDLNANLRDEKQNDLSAVLDTTFLKRLRTLAEIFDQNRKVADSISKESAASAQEDIDAILKQLGVGK